MGAKISLDLGKLALAAPTAIPRFTQQLIEKGITPPPWLGWLNMASGFLGGAITTGDDDPQLPFSIGPEGAGLSSYWRTHSEWNDEAVYNASEAILTMDVPVEFQPTASKVTDLIRFTCSAITDGKPPSREQYRRAVDAILREASTPGTRRYGDLLFFTLKLHRDR